MLAPADIISSKLVAQLGYVSIDELRGQLRALRVDSDASLDLLSRLALGGKITRGQYAEVRRYVALFEFVRYEAVFLSHLERMQGPPDDSLYELIARIEEANHRVRIGDALVARGDITEDDCAALDNMTIAFLAREDAQVVTRYVRDDFSAVARPLIAQPLIDTRSFRLPALFRSEHTLEAVNLAAQRIRHERTGDARPARPAEANVFPPVRGLGDDDASWESDTKELSGTADPVETQPFDMARFRAEQEADVPELTRIGPYQVVQRLGAGSVGRVFLAREGDKGSLIAVKILHAHAGPADRARFEREANLLARLRHPNLVSLLDRGEADGMSWIVMPAVGGRRLRDLLTQPPGTGLELGAALDVIEQLLDGVQGMHEAGVVHRDLKPENVMVLGDGRVKVIDLGLARLMADPDGSEEYRTAVGAVTGSPAYVAPETITGDRIDGRTDIYSLGVLFFEVLTGKTPLTASSPYGYLREHVVGVPLTLTRARPERAWSPQLEALLAGMLAKEQANRPPSCRTILERLRAGVRAHALATLAGKEPPGQPGIFNRFFR